MSKHDKMREHMIISNHDPECSLTSEGRIGCLHAAHLGARTLKERDA